MASVNPKILQALIKKLLGDLDIQPKAKESPLEELIKQEQNVQRKGQRDIAREAEMETGSPIPSPSESIEGVAAKPREMTEPRPQVINEITGELEPTGPGPEFTNIESGLDKSFLSKEQLQKLEDILVEMETQNPLADKATLEQMALERLTSTNIPKGSRFQGKTITQREKILKANKQAAIRGDQKFMRRGNKERFDQGTATFPGETPPEVFVPKPRKKGSRSPTVKKGVGVLSSPRLINADKVEAPLSDPRSFRNLKGDENLAREAFKEGTGDRRHLAKDTLPEQSMISSKAQESRLDLFGEEKARLQAEVAAELDQFKRENPQYNRGELEAVRKSMETSKVEAASVSKRIDEIMKQVEELFGRMGGFHVNKGTREIKSTTPIADIKKARSEQGLTEAKQRLIVQHAIFSQAAERARKSGDLTEIEGMLRELSSPNLGIPEGALPRLEGPASDFGQPAPSLDDLFNRKVIGRP